MNTSKQINVMIGLMFIMFLILMAYLVNESNREDAEAEELTTRNAERGARTFVNNCRTCHGMEGEGAVGPPLQTNAFLILGADNDYGVDETPAGIAANIRNYLSHTIECGRVGTFMPFWGQSQGGPLSDTQIEQVVTLITNQRWDLVDKVAEEVDHEQYAEVLRKEYATAAILAQRLGREPTQDEIASPGLALLAHDKGTALADLSEEELQALKDEYDALPEAQHFVITEEQVKQFGREPTAEEIYQRATEATVVTGAAAATLSVTNNVCGQYTADDKAQVRERDPFATGTPSATETPTGTETATPPPSGEGENVTVDLSEFAVALPDVQSVPAGTITFNVANVGAIPHEFVVVASDAAPDALPTDASGTVQEDQVDVVGKIPEFAGGGSDQLTLDLPAGNYVLICNIPGHYALGMTVGFTVE